jgi:hypothetical protein
LFSVPFISELKFTPDPNKKYLVKTALDPDKMGFDVSYNRQDFDNLIIWDSNG